AAREPAGGRRRGRDPEEHHGGDPDLQRRQRLGLHRRGRRGPGQGHLPPRQAHPRWATPVLDRPQVQHQGRLQGPEGGGPGRRARHLRPHVHEGLRREAAGDQGAPHGRRECWQRCSRPSRQGFGQ
ncbi:unnamed protein product, partial [Prorocentrum cordatum]